MQPDRKGCVQVNILGWDVEFVLMQAADGVEMKLVLSFACGSLGAVVEMVSQF